MNHLDLCEPWKIKMQRYVCDAGILIDIEEGKLNTALFSLPYQFIVPDILFEQELSKKHNHLLEFNLKIQKMDGALISQAHVLRQKYKRLSLYDVLALTLATNEICTLLTTDNFLKKVAKSFDIDVHGTIWLVEKMLQHQKISIEVAKQAFEYMENSGSFLPWSTAEKMLNKYFVPNLNTNQP